MAKALKYFFEFSDIDADDYKVEIWVEGFAGTATELIAGGNPLTRTYNKDVGEKYLGGIVPSVISIEAISNASFHAVDFTGQNYGDAVAVVYKNTVLQYNAIIVPFEGSDSDLNDGIYSVNLSAECGLVNLKTITFLPSGTRKKLLDVIIQCINNIPYVNSFGYSVVDNVDLRDADLNKPYYYESFIEDKFFEGLSCYDVINSIIQQYGQFTFTDGRWDIKNIAEISKVNSVKRTYSNAGVLQSSTTYTRPDESVTRIAGGDFGLMFSQKSVTIEKAKSISRSLNSNADFENASGWTFEGFGAAIFEITNGYLTNLGNTLFNPEVDGSYAQSPPTTYFPFKSSFELTPKQELKIKFKSTKGSFIKNLRLQIIAVQDLDANFYYLTNESSWYRAVEGVGTPIYAANFKDGVEEVIPIPQVPFLLPDTPPVLSNVIPVYGEFMPFPYLDAVSNLPYKIYVRVFRPERLGDDIPAGLPALDLTTQIDYIHITAEEINNDSLNGFTKKFGVSSQKDRSGDLTIKLGVGYPSFPVSYDSLFFNGSTTKPITLYNSLPIEEFIADSYLSVLSQRQKFYQGTVIANIEFGDLLDIDGEKHRIHNYEYNYKLKQANIKTIGLGVNADTIEELPVYDSDVNLDIDSILNQVDIDMNRKYGDNLNLKFVDKNIQINTLADGQKSLSLRQDFRISRLYSTDVFLRTASDGSIQDVAEDTEGNFTLIKPAKDGTYALLEDIEDLAWLQEGNTATVATKKLGTLDNFDFNIIRNNVNIGQIKSTGLDLLDNRLDVGAVQYNVATAQTVGVAKTIWNDTFGTLEFGLKGGNINYRLGQSSIVYVKSADNAGLTKGTVVYTAGSDGINKTVRLAQANAESTSSKTFGIIAETVTGGEKAFCTTFGNIEGINTSAFAEGATIYLSPTVAGGMTTTKPSAPNHMVVVGFCLRSHATQGVIFVKVQNGFELDEIHDVAIGTLANNNLLAYESSTSLWKNKTFAELGLSSGTGTTNFVTKWSNATGGLTNSQIFDNGVNVGIGTPTPLGLLELYGTGTPSGMLRIITIGGGGFTIGAKDNTANPIWRIGTNSGESLAFEVGGGTSGLFLNPFNNVGIGTDNPTYKLEVVVGSTGAFFTRLSGNVGVTAPAIGLQTATTTTRINSFGDALQFFTGVVGSTTTQKMTILADGNVGIGTTTPVSNLTINGSTGLYLRHSSGGKIIFDDTDVADASTPMSWIEGANGAINFYRANRNATTGLTTGSTQSMVINAGGSVGIGSTALTGISLRNAKIVTGATSAYGYLQDGQIQSDVTTFASLIQSNVSQVSGVTTPNVYAFIANQGTVSGTISNLHGYFVNSNLVGGVNNYGFRGLIPAGTGRWNLYMDGTAQNHFRGNVGIGAGSTVPTTELDVLGITRTTNLRITNGAAVGKVWQCNNVNGTGEWVTPLSSERYIGEWAANSGVAPSASPTTGDYYVVNTAGTYLGITYAAGDEIYWNGTAWLKRSNFLTLPIATASVLGGIKIGTGLTIDGSGVVSVASLATARTISATGDGTWSVSFNGSADVSGALTLANVATAGTYRSVTINAKGLVTAGTNPTTISEYGITDFYAQIVSGFVTGANSTVLDTDSLEVALEKLQGQINARISENQTITLSGIVTGSGTTAITTAIADAALSIAKTSGLQTALDSKQATLSGTGLVLSTAGTITYVTNNSTNWNTAFAERNRWDGGATGLVAATGRTSLGLVIGTDVQAYDADLQAIGALAGTSGILRKTAANTWSLDTNTFINSENLIDFRATTSQLGFVAIGTTMEVNGFGVINQKSGIVTTGTYRSVTVDTYGRITAGTNPTTISGYGITDAYTKTESDARFVALAGSYVNPTWIASLAWTKLTGVPTTFAPSAHTLDSHSNVTITSNSAGELLRWNGTAWINSTLAESGIQPLDADLTSIAGLTGTTGLLRKTAANTFVLDTATYLTGITSLQVTTALGFTPYNATNPSGFITSSGSITGSAATLTTARTFTIGTTGKTFNGSANVAWTLGEIGAAPTVHTHAAVDIVSGVIATARLATGTASATTFLRGDQTWATLPAPTLTSTRIGFGSGSNLLTSSANFTFESDRIIAIKEGTTSKMEVARYIGSSNYGLYVTGGNLELQSLTGGTVISKSNHNFEGRILLNNAAGTAGQVLTSQGSGANPTWTTVSGGTQNLDSVLGVGNTAINKQIILNGTNSVFDSAAIMFYKNGAEKGKLHYDNQFVERLRLSSTSIIQIESSVSVGLYGTSAIIGSLSGTGTRMVVTDASGVLSTQAIPSGGIGNIDQVLAAGNTSINKSFNMQNGGLFFNSQNNSLVGGISGSSFLDGSPASLSISTATNIMMQISAGSFNVISENVTIGIPNTTGLINLHGTPFNFNENAQNLGMGENGSQWGWNFIQSSPQPGDRIIFFWDGTRFVMSHVHTYTSGGKTYLTID